MYLPQERVTNADLSAIMDYDVESYLAEKGIGVRYRAAPNEATSDIGVRAAREALLRAGLVPEDVDLIILATDTPDFISPPTSAVIQHKLGATNAGAFDINAACTDETIALALGAHYIALEPGIDHVLVIGAYGMTKWLDWRPYGESVSKVLAMLFSDGAGAVVLSPSEEAGYLSSKMLTEGSYWDTYGIYLGTGQPPTPTMIETRRHCLRFHENGHRVPADFNSSRWPRLLRETLRVANCTPDDLNLVLMNQVDLSTVRITLEGLGLPMDRTHWVADRFGYAGSASVFMALYDAVEQGKLSAGDLVAFCTSGAGFVLSTALFRWR
ncbi:MAG TPA: ketoacyl-ACP synthase III [Candidatus Bipolaricaulis anaerobius]|nr:ketoacyl-ACP synthase III [Candidatus Bipolaricaulis anaerobius]HNS23567.1 ketoacyl-ACP synthase III [Candidatus Bipolaricaulis anaerobius]